MNKYKMLINALLFILIAFVPIATNAQNLPKIQTASVRAPDNIKIDGKTTEWNDTFQAYNVDNHIFYTISNDDNYLYFTARMDDDTGNEKEFDAGNAKVLYGGITLTIKLPAEKEDGKSKKIKDVSITFPTEYFRNKGLTILNISRNSKRFVNDTTYVSLKKVDSLSVIANKKMVNTFKEIELTGIQEIQEPSISIYNSLGINVAAQFNNRMQYVYELAIPLKYLGNSINSGKKFKYNIKLNGMPLFEPNGRSIPIFPIPENPTKANILAIWIQNATDFWGEYTLVKK
jgi:hypothetical protein